MDFQKLQVLLINFWKNIYLLIGQKNNKAAFDILKAKLCEEPLLQRPDFSQPFMLTTDASGIAIRGISSQGKKGKDKPMAYASRSLSETKKKYDTYEKEALAIILLYYFCNLQSRKNEYKCRRSLKKPY